MKLGIIGAGVVGSATARAFIGHVDEVRVYDVVKERATHDLGETLETDIVFVCLPTPQKKGSLECDWSAVDRFFMSKFFEERQRNYVLRSTVPIGTTREIQKRYNLHGGYPNIVHSPEFLSARTATFDAMMPARNIVGIPNYEHKPDANPFLLRLLGLYGTRWPHIPIHVMSSDESEATKLFQNAFSAVKIATFNEFRTLADAKGLDWDRVMQGLLAGGWVHPLHTQVPGPDGKRGFGGACLVKDTANLASHSDDTPMLRAALERNAKDRLR